MLCYIDHPDYWSKGWVVIDGNSATLLVISVRPSWFVFGDCIIECELWCYDNTDNAIIFKVMVQDQFRRIQKVDKVLTHSTKEELNNMLLQAHLVRTQPDRLTLHNAIESSGAFWMGRFTLADGYYSWERKMNFSMLCSTRSWIQNVVYKWKYNRSHNQNMELRLNINVAFMT